ncbi:carotenoid cleavage dioxygenase [Sporothrix brasiliensis 5110]|uniref:Carotenoid cleavage dioxygenase n=1 Tax=Sporothrix brasiliensis 5110 TaxID=1398154 RepID=A0A0C2IPD1_9PEZI|nr:carotenoid cleavage dioxygenase [Sporothrix brasiliensis 5110]KIH88785.1 carotenoid cleavage dioxygenase [Sporothrix brasiliensis 5110]
MAHAYSLFPEVQPAYVDGRKVGEQTKYPGTPYFQGGLKPTHIEGDVFQLETTGTIPHDIRGTFYRIQPDPRFPPVFEDDVHFSGDGAVTAFQFADGHVDAKQRYVQTDRYRAETQHRKALFGRYRNPYTDSEAVRGVIRTVSNTNITFWRGAMLASKEDGPPFALDPVTLATLGRYDFEGQVQAPCFTAHPKFDPATGDMVAFAYEAGGDGHDASTALVVWTFDAATGAKTDESWYEAPYCGMIHDAALTPNYLVLPLTPLKADKARIAAGGNHWAWDPSEDQYYGLAPRKGGRLQDIVWLRSSNAFHGHVAGAYENEDGHVVVDLTVADGNVFFWWPSPEEAAEAAASGKPPRRPQLQSDTVRWVLDPALPSGSYVQPARQYGTNGEFSRIDDRFVTKKYRHFWQLQIDPTRPYDFAKCGPPAGGLFNVLGHYDWDSLDGSGGKAVRDEWFAGPTCTFQEPVFVPRPGSTAEGDGYLLLLLNHLDVLRNDILIFDALHIAQGPLAAVHLPIQMRLGLHGNFVAQDEIERWAKRRAPDGDLGPVQVATAPLPWQVALQEKDARNGSGTNGA